MTTINFNNVPLHVPLVEDITKKMPTSFEDFVQQEQKRIQQENALKNDSNNNNNSSQEENTDKKILSTSTNAEATATAKNKTSNKKLDKHAKARNAIAEAVALTTSRAVAIENGSQSVLPGNTNATEDEIDILMKEQKDLPTGNTKEERKKRRLVRNRISAQLHRERKKQYIAALETKVKEQNEQLLHFGKIIQTLNIEYQRLQYAANKFMCPSCVSSGSDSSIPFSSSNSDTSSSCHSTPLIGTENDDLDETSNDKDEGDCGGGSKKSKKCNAPPSSAHWDKTEAEKIKIPPPFSGAAVGVDDRPRKKTKQETTVVDNNNSTSSFLDDNTDALTNSTDEDLQEYADTLLNPVNLCDEDEDGGIDMNHNSNSNSNNISALQRESSFDTSFIFNDDAGFNTNVDELMSPSNNSEISHVFDLHLSDNEYGNDEDEDLRIFYCNNNKSKKRKRSYTNKTAMLFGMFFMCAFFGSYMGGVVPPSRTVIQLPSTTSTSINMVSSLPLLGNGNGNNKELASTTGSNSRRRRRLLTSDGPQVNQSDTSTTVVAESSLALNNNVNTDDKAIALWQNILHDMKSSPPVKYPVVGNSDVKQLLLRIGNFSHSYESSKINRLVNAVKPSVNRKQALRAKSKSSANAIPENESHTLIPYPTADGAVDVNTVFTHNLLNTNASFMLCPKPYGTLATTEAQAAAPPSTYNHHDSNNFEHIPNTFMYDDIKVNRDLVLLMPSTSLGSKTGLETNQQWDGKWVQVDAVVRSVRPAASLSGLKAIAGSQ